MTTAVKEKKPFLPQRKPQPQGPGGVAVRAGGGVTTRSLAGAAALSIGGEPRVHLLPKDVVERKQLRMTKRRLLTAGIAVVAIVGIAYGGVTFALTAAQSSLNAARTSTASLLAQQAKYGAVTKVQSDMAAIKAAQTSTTTQEILWKQFMTEAESTLPAGANITAATLSVDSPIGTTEPSTATGTTVPLQGPRIATAVMTVSIGQSDIPKWLNSLPTAIKGFVDYTPGSVTAPSAGGSNYQLAVTIHLNSDAVSGRFATATPSSTATPSTTTTGGTN